MSASLKLLHGARPRIRKTSEELLAAFFEESARPTIEKLSGLINPKLAKVDSVIASFDVDHCEIIRREPNNPWRELLLCRLTNATEQAQHNMFAMCLDQNCFVRVHRLWGWSNSSDQQVAHSNLNGWMNMQLRLFDSK